MAFHGAPLVLGTQGLHKLESVGAGNAEHLEGREQGQKRKGMGSHSQNFAEHKHQEVLGGRGGRKGSPSTTL